MGFPPNNLPQTWAKTNLYCYDVVDAKIYYPNKINSN